MTEWKTSGEELGILIPWGPSKFPSLYLWESPVPAHVAVATLEAVVVRVLSTWAGNGGTAGPTVPELTPLAFLLAGPTLCSCVLHRHFCWKKLVIQKALPLCVPRPLVI